MRNGGAHRRRDTRLAHARTEQACAEGEGDLKRARRDLIGGLGDKAKSLGKARKELEKLEKQGRALSAPLPKVVADRVERKAAYDKTSKQVCTPQCRAVQRAIAKQGGDCEHRGAPFPMAGA